MSKPSLCCRGLQILSSAHENAAASFSANDFPVATSLSELVRELFTSFSFVCVPATFAGAGAANGAFAGADAATVAFSGAGATGAFAGAGAATLALSGSGAATGTFAPSQRPALALELLPEHFLLPALETLTLPAVGQQPGPFPAPELSPVPLLLLLSPESA
eukprot:CAMPEP_0180421830 /NCGR_PEP_ID=MMETSP1036_2-20121128/3358_1 /TAXON_ID=632150 /ORGANISM="Azadinium spinosum, Strain 3D9" /LENGTH=161 /DNA_ID=CAMNT_0022427117 /DNA_START=272 /DNA_END=755 /DNA_ORIENTATION=+